MDFRDVINNFRHYISDNAVGSAISGFLTGGPLGAISGGLKGAAENEEREYEREWKEDERKYQRELDAWNKGFQELQFKESVRQYEQNRDDERYYWENNVNNVLSQYEQNGINPLAASGAIGAGAVSGGVAGSSVSSNSTEPAISDNAGLTDAVRLIAEAKMAEDDRKHASSLQESDLRASAQEAASDRALQRELASSASATQLKMQQNAFKNDAARSAQEVELLKAQVREQQAQAAMAEQERDYWAKVNLPPSASDKIRLGYEGAVAVSDVKDKVSAAVSESSAAKASANQRKVRSSAVKRSLKAQSKSASNFLYSQVEVQTILDQLNVSYERYKTDGHIRAMVNQLAQERIEAGW